MGETHVGVFKVRRVKVAPGDVRHIVFDFYGAALGGYDLPSEAYAEASRLNAIEMRRRSRPTPTDGADHE